MSIFEIKEYIIWDNTEFLMLRLVICSFYYQWALED
jgi:hypothetical protein